jgi:uncharacterized glyoxalase superfamily protein PhnB
MSLSTRSSVIPSLHYRDAHAAIDWLCAALGFEKQAVYDDGQGGVAHAQLRFGDGMVMLGSHRKEGWGAYMAMPGDVGGRQTQTCYLVVAEIEDHYASAVAAGAAIIETLTDKDYGGKGYACRDPEGHLWSIGSYDPWA